MYEWISHEDEKLNEAVRAIGQYVREYNIKANVK
jgi:hypothetical protein